MRYAYTKTPVDGYVHRNPLYWTGSTPPRNATEVIVDPEFPEIAAHFGDLVKKPETKKRRKSKEVNDG